MKALRSLDRVIPKITGEFLNWGKNLLLSYFKCVMYSTASVFVPRDRVLHDSSVTNWDSLKCLRPSHLLWAGKYSRIIRKKKSKVRERIKKDKLIHILTKEEMWAMCGCHLYTLPGPNYCIKVRAYTWSQTCSFRDFNTWFLETIFPCHTANLRILWKVCVGEWRALSLSLAEASADRQQRDRQTDRESAMILKC